MTQLTGEGRALRDTVRAYLGEVVAEMESHGVAPRDCLDVIDLVVRELHQELEEQERRPT